jgi:hypothetical protein
VALEAPRPQRGDLMKECNDETTLYGRELRVDVSWGKHRRQRTWRESLYDASTDRARYEVQRRYWRRGRGEATAADDEADMRADWLMGQERRWGRRRNAQG